MKHCNSCNKDKPFSEFYKRKEKYQHKCKGCEKEYKNKNAERQKELKKKHYNKYKDKILKRVKEYKKMHGARMTKEMFKKRPEQRVLHNLRTRLNELLKSSKQHKTSELIGCTPIELKKHLERQFRDGMTWENHGKDGWHVDHIIPCCKYDLKNEAELRQSFHFSNLQPMWAKDNMTKGGRLLMPTQIKIAI